MRVTFITSAATCRSMKHLDAINLAIDTQIQRLGNAKILAPDALAHAQTARELIQLRRDYVLLLEIDAPGPGARKITDEFGAR